MKIIYEDTTRPIERIICDRGIYHVCIKRDRKSGSLILRSDSSPNNWVNIRASEITPEFLEALGTLAKQILEDC